MILDFASQEGLEIFNMTQNEEEENEKYQFSCLADLIDNTVTPYGRRLIRKWLGAPLIDTEEIQLRQEAIQDLLDNYNIVANFKHEMEKIKDLERMLARVFSYSIAS